MPPKTKPQTKQTIVSYQTPFATVYTKQHKQYESKSRGANTKNPHCVGFILAHPARFPRTTQICVGCGATVTFRTARCLFLTTCCRTQRVQIAGREHKKSPLRGAYFGAPGAIRTRSPRLRRAMLYPVEPRVQGLHIIIICIKNAIYFIVCSRCKHAIIKSSKSPSKTASESVFSTPVRTSLTNWYGYKT